MFAFLRVTGFEVVVKFTHIGIPVIPTQIIVIPGQAGILFRAALVTFPCAGMKTG
jgi:hypothetical protein